MMRIWALVNRRWILVLSAVLFTISLTQTAFVVESTYILDRSDPRDFYGIELLLTGWVGVLIGPELISFRGVAIPVNLLLWPPLLAFWVFACRRWLVAAAIVGLCIAGLISVTPNHGYFDNIGSLGYAAWLANPGLIATWVLYLCDKKPAALISAVISLGLTLSFLMVKGGPFGHKESDLVPVISYGIGYWLWITSAAILAAGICVDMCRSQDQRKVGSALMASSPCERAERVDNEVS
jgi:hypothetical protein